MIKKEDLEYIGCYTIAPAFYEAPIYRYYNEENEQWEYYICREKAKKYEKEYDENIIEIKTIDNVKYEKTDESFLAMNLVEPWSEVLFNKFEDNEEGHVGNYSWSSPVYDSIDIFIEAKTQQEVINIIQQIMLQYSQNMDEEIDRLKKENKNLKEKLNIS